LRGRAGRQGDVGETVFYISFEDDLLRLFGGERLANLSLINSFPDNEPISSGMFTKTVENAQKRKEGANFNGRKHVLEYDDVVNQQRIQIYKERDQIMADMDLSEKIAKMRRDVIDRQLDTFCVGEPEDWNLQGLKDYLEGNLYFPTRDENGQPLNLLEGKESVEELREILQKLADDSAAFIEEKLSPVHTRELERFVMLGAIDRYWMDHIDAMDDLRQGISLQAYGNRNPLVEYQLQSDEMFRETVYAIREQAVFDCLRMFRAWAVNVVRLEEFVRAENARQAVARKLKLSHVKVNDQPGKTTESGKGVTLVKGKKVGPNEPCPCGSGKKYKKCCGSNI
jgi:preprotein translocase subunit SecA